MNTTILRRIAASAAFAAASAGAQIVHDGNAQVVMQEGRTVLIYNTNGTFTVTSPCTVELLAVGGGGGGGTYLNDHCGTGGGGAGGVVTNPVALQAGTYSVSIGEGGAIGANGGDTVLSSDGLAVVTAYGGGAGAGGAYNGGGAGKNGASGGGGSLRSSSDSVQSGGNAIHGDSGNLGNKGGSSSTSLTGAGGGGGAKEAGGDGNESNPGKGGDGIEVAIVGPGPDNFFGGGGAAWRTNRSVTGSKGGGGKLASGVGYPGEDGKGGGGCGTQRGGSGVMILAFTRTAEPPAKDGFFEGNGGDETLVLKLATGKEEVRIFRESGMLTMTGKGTVEVLAVGGGGGGGAFGTNSEGPKYGCGGGGAGGVVHYTNLVVSAGTYEIEIGEGGAVGANGGVTRGLGVVAYGGGAGAGSGNLAGAGKNGASGGGAAWPTVSGSGGATTNAAGLATLASYMNKGHDGGPSNHVYCPGGGGGAGAAGAFGGGVGPGAGGNGYECVITGVPTYYGGGGAGLRGDQPNYNVSGGLGGGGSKGAAGLANTGGGGSGNAAGGSGIFIVRYKLKPNATVIYMR